MPNILRNYSMKTKKITPIQARLIELAKSNGSRLFRLENDEFRSFSQFDYEVINQAEWTREDITDLWFEPVFLSYGSYNNSSTVERSNHQYFTKHYGHLKGIDTFSGCYSYNSVLISIEHFKNIEAIEILEGLLDYPLIDDISHTDLEMELQSEAYENDYRSEFIKELRERIESDLEDDSLNDLDRGYAVEILELLEKQEDITSGPDDRIWYLFRVFEDVTNTYWQCEDPFSAYIDVERMINGIGNKVEYKVMDSLGDQIWIPKLSYQGIAKILLPENFKNPNQVEIDFRQGSDNGSETKGA